MVHTQKWKWKLRLTTLEAKLRSLLKLVFRYSFKYVRKKKWGADLSPLSALHGSEFPNCVRYERVQSVSIASVVSSLWAIHTSECPLLRVDGGTCYTEGSGEEGQPFHSPQLLGGRRWSWLVITGWIVSISWLMTQHRYPKVFFHLYQLIQHTCMEKNGGTGRREVGGRVCSLCWVSIKPIFHAAALPSLGL